jgi:hypothetical protein
MRRGTPVLPDVRVSKTGLLPGSGAGKPAPPTRKGKPNAPRAKAIDTARPQETSAITAESGASTTGTAAPSGP